MLHSFSPAGLRRKTGFLLNSCLLLSVLSVTACGRGDSDRETDVPSRPAASADVDGVTVRRVTLTVAEGKRLIAKGLARYAPVRERMSNGVVVVTRGSSNTYLAEELLQTNLVHGAFLTGRIQPAGAAPLNAGERIGDIVIRNGKYEPDTKLIAGLRSMRPGDIVFKGANLLNYAEKKAAVCIAHPTGGTMGMFLPFVEEAGVRLIVPIGLEKQTSQDLDALEKRSRSDHALNPEVPWLKVLSGEVFTEIEAIRQFADVEVYQLASGGISGAEGAVMLAIKGQPPEVERAVEAIASVQGEPAF